MPPEEEASALVTLEQAILPKTPAPPGIKGLIRRLCAKQAYDMMEVGGWLLVGRMFAWSCVRGAWDGWRRTDVRLMEASGRWRG